MPRYSPDGLTQVWWADVADPAFVAQSELVAAPELACHLTKDGLKLGFNENTTDDAALCEVYDATLPGSFGTQAELTLKRRNTVGGDTDIAWNLLSTRGETGALVVRRGIDADLAPTAGQPVEVYPGSLGIRRPADTASNEQEKFMISIYGSEEPELDGIIVAS